MFNEIYKTIEQFDKIVLARHIGPDPDAMSSTMALKDSIMLTFPNKKAYAVGTGSMRFNYFDKLDKIDDPSNALLIVLDTPDIRRIDGVDLADFSKIIKIDHHPFVDKFADLEYIDDTDHDQPFIDDTDDQQTLDSLEKELNDLRNLAGNAIFFSP